MKEAILLILVAASSIFILGYSIHMLIGGLVSESTEQWIIVCACLLGTAILAFMGWDILRQRRLR
jgi:biotin transporter BioY